MKIALVGKWWSGKSSLSRLITQYLSQEHKVLAIDSDHNMDFTNLLQYDVTELSPTFKDSYDNMVEFLQYQEKVWAKQVIRENLWYKKFFLEPIDEFSEKNTIQLSPTIRLGIVWLWSDDVMTDNRCAHGMSNPLKVYLSLLDEGDRNVVVDGVAWVDMINFWLYHACDFLVIPVEPSKNSIRVAEQIKRLCDMSLVNYGFVINKYSENDLLPELERMFEWQIIWKIWYDNGLFSYNYDHISETTKKEVKNIVNHIKQHRWTNLVERMMKLEELKTKK